MMSAPRGRSTSVVEITDVSISGFRILIGDRDIFVSFRNFPWFEGASIPELMAVELPSPHHLYWPKLDVDLAVDSLDHPERYPLVSGGRRRPLRTGAASR